MTESKPHEGNTIKFGEAKADPMAAIKSLGLTDAAAELEDRG